jgi:hypothetical protein
VSVRVNDVISVAGWVLPGSRVDVIVTLRPAQESISRIVLTNVKVLSTGANIDTSQAREATVFTYNAASGRALEKAGFIREATSRCASIKDGRIYDEWLYARLAEGTMSHVRPGG